MAHGRTGARPQEARESPGRQGSYLAGLSGSHAAAQSRPSEDTVQDSNRGVE